MIPLGAKTAEPELYESLPGMNMPTMFCNMSLTYEDDMVMSRSVASKLRYPCKKRVKLWDISAVPAINSKIPPFSRSWWQVGFEGTVVDATRSVSDSIIVYIEFVGLPVNGHKFTTLHGQKGVVTILPDTEMLIVSNQHAELVIGSSVIIKRGTASQLIEAAYGMYCINHSIDHCKHDTDEIIGMYVKDYRVSPRIDAIDSICKRYESDVYMPDKQGISQHITRRIWKIGSSISSTQSVRANYGYIRVMQSVFMASTSMSCTQVKSGKKQRVPMSIASKGGSIGLGEMELQQLEACGMKNCVTEFCVRSDLCKVDVCCKCKCITITCTCDKETRDKRQE